MAELPVDFEQKVKQPAPPNGQGYPVQLSARDLMLNFKFINDRLPEPDADGQILYSSHGEWFILEPGEVNQVLTMYGGTPQWHDPESSGGPSGDTFKLEINRGYYVYSTGGSGQVNFVEVGTPTITYYVDGVAFLEEPDGFPGDAEVRYATHIATA